MIAVDENKNENESDSESETESNSNQIELKMQNNGFKVRYGKKSECIMNNYNDADPELES